MVLLNALNQSPEQVEGFEGPQDPRQPLQQDRQFRLERSWGDTLRRSTESLRRAPARGSVAKGEGLPNWQPRRASPA